MKISDALLPEFDQEMASTRKVLERCADDRLGWRPHPKSFTMAELATHIVNIPGWGVDTMTKASFDIAPPGAPPYKEEPAGSRKELLERFDKNVTTLRSAIASASDEQFMQAWSLLSGGNPIFTMPRVALMRGFVMNHGIHHRAQLGVYLRLNDIPVPQMYGPTADEPNM